MILLLYGQPGSGKTTVADNLVAYHDWHRVDGDDLREFLPNPGYDLAGRQENIRRAWIISRYLEGQGHNVVVSLVNPYEDLREKYWPEAIHVLLDGRPGDRPDEYLVEDFEEGAYNMRIRTEEDDLEETIRTVHWTLANLS